MIKNKPTYKEIENKIAEIIVQNEVTLLNYDFQNQEKEKRAAELVIANKELTFQNQEKEKRAAELAIANKELTFQNQEKEKRAQELIVANEIHRETNEYLENLFNYANAQIIVWNAEYEIIRFNKAFESLTGRAEKDVIGKSLDILFPPISRDSSMELIKKTLEGENMEVVEIDILHIDGSVKILLWNSATIMSGDGRTPIAIIAQGQNITKRKQAEEEIKKLNKTLEQHLIERTAQIQQIEKRAAELIIANAELAFQNEEKEKRASELILANIELAFQNKEKQKRAAELIIADKELIYQNEQKAIQEAANKELEAFSYSVSHDLRAPLRHIGGFADLLIKNNSSQLDATGLRYLNIISESSVEMGNLIDALLTFSRLSRAELQRMSLDSKSMVTRILKTFSDEFCGRNIEVILSELPNAMGDENLIYQVWVNLISNALKYSRNKDKALIEIGGKTDNDFTIFHIRDNGAGFDMKYAGKLFGVFQRLHKARDFEGIGIGLANVNRIITRHGGKCWAESEVGNGATFFFSIPNHCKTLIKESN